jgi:tRNA pseudouridine55 synthase
VQNTGAGVLVLDKPEGCSSHNLVQQVKKMLGAAKAGHSGTLDPFATGVLIVLINEATKLSPFLTDLEKSYRFTVVFGTETDTQDSTGKVVARSHCEPIPQQDIEQACGAFTGMIEQTVPEYSAVRVEGQRLYRLARRGVPINPPKRTVEIKHFSMHQLGWPEATFEVTCSKGTYVRSLGRDLAHHLNCCGHVNQLRRVRIGWFHESQALTLEQLDEILSKGELGQVLVSPAQALQGYPEVQVSHLTARKIRQGSTLEATQVLSYEEGQLWPEGPCKVVDPDADLVAMVTRSSGDCGCCQEGKITYKTLRVFGTG